MGDRYGSPMSSGPCGRGPCREKCWGFPPSSPATISCWRIGRFFAPFAAHFDPRERTVARAKLTLPRYPSPGDVGGGADRRAALTRRNCFHCAITMATHAVVSATVYKSMNQVRAWPGAVWSMSINENMPGMSQARPNANRRADTVNHSNVIFCDLPVCLLCSCAGEHYGTSPQR